MLRELSKEEVTFVAGGDSGFADMDVNTDFGAISATVSGMSDAQIAAMSATDLMKACAVAYAGAKAAGAILDVVQKCIDIYNSVGVNGSISSMDAASLASINSEYGGASGGSDLYGGHEGEGPGGPG